MNDYIIYFVVLVVFIIVAAIYMNQSDYTTESLTKNLNKKLNISRPKRGKKRIKFNTKVERRDYDKETGDIVDKMTVKINDNL